MSILEQIRSRNRYLITLHIQLTCTLEYPEMTGIFIQLKPVKSEWRERVVRTPFFLEKLRFLIQTN